MQVSDNKIVSKDYYAPDKRSIANGIQILLGVDPLNRRRIIKNPLFSFC